MPRHRISVIPVADGTPAESADQNGVGAVQTPAAAAGYVVVRGDSLWLIAKNQLGSGNRWTEIYELNKGIIAKPELIYAGQALVMP